MQRTRTHIAQVMDSHGRTLGVVFLEDVLEELIGFTQCFGVVLDRKSVV